MRRAGATRVEDAPARCMDRSPRSATISGARVHDSQRLGSRTRLSNLSGRLGLQGAATHGVAVHRQLAFFLRVFCFGWTCELSSRPDRIETLPTRDITDSRRSASIALPSSMHACATAVQTPFLL